MGTNYTVLQNNMKHTRILTICCTALLSACTPHYPDKGEEIDELTIQGIPQKRQPGSRSSIGYFESRGNTYEILATRKGVGPPPSDGVEWNYILVKNPRLPGLSYGAYRSEKDFSEITHRSSDYAGTSDGRTLVFLDAKPVAELATVEGEGRFIRSPWTNKILDITGIGSGMVIKDPEDSDPLRQMLAP